MRCIAGEKLLELKVRREKEGERAGKGGKVGKEEGGEWVVERGAPQVAEKKRNVRKV